MRLHGMAIAMLSLALGVAGCTVPPEQRAHDVATAYCRCTEVGDTAVDKCVEMLVPNIQTVSDECLDCVYENSATCSKLFTDCETPCTQPNMPRLLGGSR